MLLGFQYYWQNCNPCSIWKCGPSCAWICSLGFSFFNGHFPLHKCLWGFFPPPHSHQTRVKVKMGSTQQLCTIHKNVSGKIWLGSKWNTTLWVVPVENFREQRNTWKGCPVSLDGMFRTEIIYRREEADLAKTTKCRMGTQKSAKRTEGDKFLPCVILQQCRCSIRCLDLQAPSSFSLRCLC